MMKKINSLALGAFYTACVALPLSLFIGLWIIVTSLHNFITDPMPWTEYGRIQDANGNKYVFRSQSFLQAQTMALAQVTKSTDQSISYKVLGTNNGDSPRSFLTIVRPSSTAESYGQLYLANEQWLLGVRSDNHCYLAYDLVNKKFYGHGDIEKLSPFLALEATQQLNAADVAKIEKLLKEASSFQDGRPSKEGIEQGLNHPNPEVRKLAAEWLPLF